MRSGEGGLCDCAIVRLGRGEYGDLTLGLFNQCGIPVREEEGLYDLRKGDCAIGEKKSWECAMRNEGEPATHNNNPEVFAGDSHLPPHQPLSPICT